MTARGGGGLRVGHEHNSKKKTGMRISKKTKDDFESGEVGKIKSTEPIQMPRKKQAILGKTIKDTLLGGGGSFIGRELRNGFQANQGGRNGAKKVLLGARDLTKKKYTEKKKLSIRRKVLGASK